MKRVVKVGAGRLEYILIQTARNSVLLQALPEGQTRVYAPKWMRLRDIDEAVRQNAEGIGQMHRDLDRKLDEDRKSHPMGEGARIFVEGNPMRLHLHEGRTRCEADGGELHLWVKEPQDAEAVRAALKHVLAERALVKIRERLNVFAPRVGGSYGRVTIRDQRSRWGSCSSKHNLNFNWKLIMAPPQVLDYVVIHELCHLHEFNHSERFWALVQKQMPEYEAWKKWLKVHGCELGVG